MDNVTRIMVNNRYFPNSGTTSDVDGIISAKSKKNTVRDTRMDTERATWVTRKDKIVNIHSPVLQFHFGQVKTAQYFAKAPVNC